MLRTGIILALCTSFAFSAEIFSDYLERLPNKTLIAKGRVQAYYEKYYLEADYVRYNPETKEVYAEGNVYVKSSDGKIEAWGKSAFINLKEDTGYFLDTHGRFEKFYITAQRVDKDKEVYYVEKGDITTCPPNRKEMTLCFSHAKVTEKYVFSYNNSLRLFKIPLAYLPLSVFPVGERRSGLLPPVIGSNTYNTFIYQQPLYWAIAQDKDATLTFNLRDKQASGLSLEYRQAISKKKDVYADLSFYKEPTPPGKWWEGRDLSTFRENRYKIKFDLDLGNLKAGLDTVSDPYFLQDIYLHTKDKTIPYLTSYISYTKDTDSILFTFNAERFYDNTSPNNKRTLHRLPEIGLYYKDTQLFGKLYFNTTFNYTNFYREVGARAHRVLLFPQIALPLNVFDRVIYSTLTFEGGFYFSSNLSNTDRSFFTIHLNQRLPFFFDRKWKDTDFKNVFEISHSYRPKGYNNPRFDNLDSIDKENIFRLTFRNYTFYKGRQVLSWYLEGGYSLLGGVSFGGQQISKKLVPVRSILSLFPLPFVNLKSNILYDPNHTRILNNVNYLNLYLKNSGITLGYVQSKDILGNRLNDQLLISANSSYKNMTMKLGLTRDNRNNKDLLRQIRLDYAGSCWSFGLLLKDNYDGNRKKHIKEVFLTFNVFDLQKLTLPLRR